MSFRHFLNHAYLLPFVPRVLDRSVEFLFIHVEIINDQLFCQTSARANHDGPRGRAHHRHHQSCQEVNSKGIGGEIFLNALFGELLFMNHASSVVDQYINCFDMLFKIIHCFFHRFNIADLAQYKTDVLVGGLIL